MHSVTDRRTDRQVDDRITPIADRDRLKMYSQCLSLRVSEILPI